MSSEVTRTWAGSPSRIATREGPWDSPAVNQRSMRAVFHGRYGAVDGSPEGEMGRQRDASQRADQEERAERQRVPQRRTLPTAYGAADADQREQHERRVEAHQPLRRPEDSELKADQRREP